MATAVESQTTSYRFDDRNMRWRALGDFEHFEVFIFSVDEQRNIADFIVKFEPNKQIFRTAIWPSPTPLSSTVSILSMNRTAKSEKCARSADLPPANREMRTAKAAA